MRKIITTNNSIRLIDENKTSSMVYEKADLCCKVSENAIYFYNVNDVAYTREIFTVFVPVEVDGIEYDSISAVSAIFDSFFKSDIDVKTLESSLRIEDQLDVVIDNLEHLNVTQEISLVKQETMIDNQESMIVNQGTMITRLNTIIGNQGNLYTSVGTIIADMLTTNTLLNNLNTKTDGTNNYLQNLNTKSDTSNTTLTAISNKLTTIDGKLATMLTELASIKVYNQQQVQLLQQILDK